MAVTGAVLAAVAIAKVISAVSDATIRRRFEMAVADMSQRQQIELANKLMEAESQTDKLAILSSSIVQYAAANQNEADRNNTVMYLVAGGLGVALLIVALLVALKKKKN